MNVNTFDINGGTMIVSSLYYTGSGTPTITANTVNVRVNSVINGVGMRNYFNYYIAYFIQ